MANEIQFDGNSGSTSYALVRNSIAQIFNTSTLLFETFNPSNYGNYVIGCTEQGGSGYFVGNFPSAIGTGIYSIIAKQQNGGSPAQTDTTVSTGNLDWNGSVASYLGLFPFQKSTALNNFPFVMYNAITNAPQPGLAVTATRSIDGGAFFPCSNSVSEIGNGVYSISLTSSDLNGSNIMFRMSSPAALDTDFSLITQTT